MPSEEIHFSNPLLRLAGTLVLPNGPGLFPTLVVVHAASGATRNYPFYRHLVERLPAQGMAVFIYDRRGSGQSKGNFETANFHDLAGDVLAAVDHLRAHPQIDPQRIGLYGISQGGWIAPLAAARDPGIAFLILVSASGVSPAVQMDYSAEYTLRQAGFSSTVIRQALALRGRVNAYYRGQLTRLELLAEISQAQGKAWFASAYLPGSEELPEDIARDKWYYEMDYDPLPVWQQVYQPSLFLFAEEDRWVPVDTSLTNYRRVTRHLPQVQYTQIPGTDHLMGVEENEQSGQVSERYVNALLNWLRHQDLLG